MSATEGFSVTDSLGYTIFLDPKDTVRAFEQHAVAFTVAKIAKLDLLTSVYSSLDDVIRNGGTFEQWKANLLPELQRQGWWGAVNNRDLTGTDETVIVNERRLRTIYDTNVRMSLASGNWQRIQRQKDVLPWLRYLPSTSERRRPLHKLWYGVLRRVDDPWWQTHFPPNGWGCKCHFEQVSERRRKRMGWEPSAPEDIPGGPPKPFRTADGSEIMVPDGIDPGFGYNPGTAHLRAIADKALTSIQRALDAGLETHARETVREIVDDAAFEQFMGLRDGHFPIAVLTSEQRNMIGSTSQLVVVPMKIMLKQQGMLGRPGHPDLITPDYRRLRDLIAEADCIIQQGDIRLVFVLARDAASKNRWWKAIVRQDVGETNPAIVSYQPADDREIRREARKGTIILDKRA